MTARQAIAVVIPVLNEVERIGALLGRLDGFDEVIVVDGGSTDGTLAAVAADRRVRLLRTAPGRGLQLAAGVRAARSDLLLFLHADTLPPPDAPALIRHAMSDPTTTGGCFRLSFKPSSPLLALYGSASRFETAATTFGDAAFFTSRAAYTAAGGFPDWPLLEDVELRRRLRRLGRFRKLSATVVTSARRFAREGALRRQLLNAVILARFHLGASPERLARLYRAEPRREPPRSPGEGGSP